MANSLDADQARRSVVPNLGRTVCKRYQQTTLVGKKLKIDCVYLMSTVVSLADLTQNLDIRKLKGLVESTFRNQ